MMASYAASGHDPLAMIEYDDMPSVLVLSDGSGAQARDAARAARCRIMTVAPLKDAIGWLDGHNAASAVWLDLDQRADIEVDPILDRLTSAARAGRYGSVINAPMRLIDRVEAAALNTRINLLCDATAPDGAAALASATAPAGIQLNEFGRAEQIRLQKLSEEVGRIASVLAELSDDDLGEAAGSPGGDVPPLTSAPIRAMIRARRLRDRFFPDGLFADPAWDMLLDLMAARLERRRVAVSSLCIAAAVPPTTALRWIRTLTDEGLFARVADPEDGRRVYVELTDHAAAAFETYLRAAQRVGGLAV